MKTFDPPLEALVGREITGVRRIAKMPVVTFFWRPLALDPPDVGGGACGSSTKRASLKDRASRVADPARRRPRAAPARVRHQAAGLGEAAAERGGRRGRDGGDARAGSVAGAAAGGVRRGDRQAAPPPSPPCATRKTSAGIGRSWVDEILWEARPLALQEKAPNSTAAEVEQLHAALHVLGDAIDHYEQTIGPPAARQSPDAAAGPQARGRGPARGLAARRSRPSSSPNTR